MNTKCPDHSGHVARIDNLEEDKGEQWKAIDNMRDDIKKMLQKIGFIVGGIAVVQMIALIIIDKVWK
jgi:hypothetical protein